LTFLILPRRLSQAISYANKAGVVLVVAAAGNENTSARVYPASISGSVVGIASTTDWDAALFLLELWDSRCLDRRAARENVISTYPGGTYGASPARRSALHWWPGTVALMLSAKQPLNKVAGGEAHCLTQSNSPPTSIHGRLDAYQAITAWVQR